MKPLNAEELLDVWEQGLNGSTLQRVLLLLTAAHPDMDFDSVATLSIGTRDALLLQLREWLFGSRLVNTAVCPRCSERVEWDSDIEDIRVQASLPSASSQPFSLRLEPYHLQFRLPNSLDIAAVLDRDNSDAAHAALLQRCILAAKSAGTPCDVDQLPDAVLQALGHRIEALDPQADIHIRLTCPRCTLQWDVLFDIGSFLWVEINSWAERTLQTVHRLAGAYGWSEREILNLSPVRRQLYVGLVQP